jgi:hypothetical protein
MQPPIDWRQLLDSFQTSMMVYCPVSDGEKEVFLWAKYKVTQFDDMKRLLKMSSYLKTVVRQAP